MICQQCKDEGERSRVDYGGAEETLLGFLPYWDESGRRHDHNPNWMTESFRCSRGHSWTARRKRPCMTCGNDWWKDSKEETHA